MQTVLWASLMFGLLIQRSSTRLLVEQCGISVSTMISNGQNAEPEAAAWMASVGNETQFLCGGTVIHKRFVLTAAHCLKNQGRLIVGLGAYNISRPVVQFIVSKAEMHRGYSEETLRHDIGLLQLPIDIVFNAQIHPICINLHPTMKRQVEIADTFDAYGWGKTRATRISQILQRVTIDHYDRSRCNRISYTPLTSNQICAGSSTRDTCYGDSGGPLIKEFDYNGIKRPTQLGIISYGLTTCRGLGIYTDVTNYADWIEEKINQQFPVDSWPPSPTAIPEPDSISPPTETGSSGFPAGLGGYTDNSVKPVSPGLMDVKTDNLRENPDPLFPDYSRQLTPNPYPVIEIGSYDANNLGRAQLLVDKCGTSLSARIVDGINAEADAAAWMAGIFSKTYFVCGSTVIHKRYVLTAAHCVFNLEDLSVKLGAYNLRRPTVEYIVSKKIIHEEYDTSVHIHDIALLELSSDIQFSWRVYPICIILNPEVKDQVENVHRFDSYGWENFKAGQPSNPLQKVTVSRFDRSQCNQFFGIQLASSQICATASIDFTNGDTGGPLTKRVVLNGLERQTQWGIASFGSIRWNGIGVSTDVASYVDWIMRIVRNYEQQGQLNVRVKMQNK